MGVYPGINALESPEYFAALRRVHRPDLMTELEKVNLPQKAPPINRHFLRRHAPTFRYRVPIPKQAPARHCG